MAVRSLRRRGPARVDYDDDATVSSGLAQPGHEMGGGANRVVAPEDHQFAVKDVAIGLAPAFTERCLHRALGGGSADAALELACSQTIPQAGT